MKHIIISLFFPQSCDFHGLHFLFIYLCKNHYVSSFIHVIMQFNHMILFMICHHIFIYKKIIINIQRKELLNAKEIQDFYYLKKKKKEQHCLHILFVCKNFL